MFHAMHHLSLQTMLDEIKNGTQAPTWPAVERRKADRRVNGVKNPSLKVVQSNFSQSPVRCDPD